MRAVGVRQCTVLCVRHANRQIQEGRLVLRGLPPFQLRVEGSLEVQEVRDLDQGRIPRIRR
eukprot:12682960-Heterocapsa_arctica.AAC.1